MDDNNWDLGAVIRNSYINKSNNNVAPNLDFESSNFNSDDWSLLDSILDEELILIA